MKNIVFLFLLITQFFWAQNGFEKGNEWYRKGNYNEAIINYEGVLKSKNHSAELYYNLGNCYYKLNKVAPAIYNFEKALLLNPNDKEIQNNLRFAQKLQIDDIKEVPKVGFNKIIQDLVSTYHYNTWGWIAVSCSIVFLLFFIGYYFSNTTVSKRLFFTAMVVSLLVLATAVIAAVAEKQNYESDRPAIVFAEVLPVKTEPKPDAPDAFMLHEGSKVFVIETLDNWKKIQLEDEKTGWIEASTIKELK